jgi:hypothetical protein
LLTCVLFSPGSCRQVNHCAVTLRSEYSYSLTRTTTFIAAGSVLE